MICYQAPVELSKFLSNWSRYKCRTILPLCEVQFIGILEHYAWTMNQQIPDNQFFIIYTNLNYWTTATLYQLFSRLFFAFSPRKRCQKNFRPLFRSKKNNRSAGVSGNACPGRPVKNSNFSCEAGMGNPARLRGGSPWFCHGHMCAYPNERFSARNRQAGWNPNGGTDVKKGWRKMLRHPFLRTHEIIIRTAFNVHRARQEPEAGRQCPRTNLLVVCAETPNGRQKAQRR